MKTAREIEEAIAMAERAVDDPKIYGQTYEEGVLAALMWVLGEIKDLDEILR